MKRKTRASFNHQLTFGPKRRKRGRWVFPALLLIAGGLAYGLSSERPTAVPQTASSAAPAEAPPLAAAPAPEPPPVKKIDIDYVVKPNDTLGQIFTTLKLDVTELPALLNDPVVRQKFKPLKPGDELTLALENGVLHGLRRRLSETEVLSITRGDNGFAATVVTTPIETRTAQVRGTINSSLWVAGHAVGLAPQMVQQLASDIFGWHVDLALDIRPGDRFNVIYEQKYRAHEYLGDGRIVAAELVSNGEAYRAVRYTSADGKIDDYFTPDGRSVRRQFVRAPIDFTRVSANAHPTGRAPVITTLREHHGIDYPAPVGTVVKAAGDGRIKFVGANGEYGNTVIIEHGGRLSTLYAHLSAFARGLEPNRHVKQGETIGYVGNTGASTAPHLHYEYRVDGTYTDPRTAEPTEGASIPEQYLADFQSKSAALLASLEQPGDAIVTALLTN